MLLAGSFAVSLAACAPETADVSEIFDEENKISYCTTYKKLSETKENKTGSWRQGMVSGNGRRRAVQRHTDLPKHSFYHAEPECTHLPGHF